MKQFHEPWSDAEVRAYLEDFGVLVLFDIQNNVNNVAEIIIHGKLTKNQKDVLMENITNNFGGVSLSNVICDKINEYAEKWYSKEILRRKARVINIKRK